MSLCLLLAIVSGCTTNTSISTPEAKALTKQLKQEFKHIKEVDLSVFTKDVQWVVTWKTPPTEEESRAAFESIRQYVSTEGFFQYVVEGIYMKDFSREGDYPHVSVIYDMNNDSIYDRKFYAHYDLALMGFGEWFYSTDYVSNLEPLDHANDN